MSEFKDVNFGGLGQAKQDRVRAPTVKPVATNDGVAVYSSQYARVGELVDMWADLMVGHGDKAAEFWTAFQTHFRERGMTDVGPYSQQLPATGLWAPYRQMEFVMRGVVAIPIYVAIQGNDLYVSWRAFIQGQLSLIKALLWFFLSFLVALPFSLNEEMVGWGETSTTLDLGGLLTTGLVIFFATSAFGAAYGYFFRQGDWEALLREPLNELQVDDVASLSNAVHISILAAADTVGIDTTKLQEREPFYNARGRKRRI